jgi:Domain of unknown function (DUF6973)
VFLCLCGGKRINHRGTKAQSFTEIEMKWFQIGLFAIVLFQAPIASGQDTPKSHFKNLSGPEKCWVIFHPFVAKKAYRLSVQAREVSKELLTDPLFDGDENGGQIDAFRHGYWMALLSQHMCWKQARSLGRAHEKGNYKAFKKGQLEEGLLADSAGSAMDLYNNAVGLQIGRSGKNIAVEELKGAVKDSVLAGKMKVIRKNAAGLALDCDGQVIDTAIYKGRWVIPKCLVGSDAKRK